jgi:hypothetical protein
MEDFRQDRYLIGLRTGIYTINPLTSLTTSFGRFCSNLQRLYKMVKMEFHIFLFIFMNTNEDIRVKQFEIFLTVHVFYH